MIRTLLASVALLVPASLVVPEPGDIVIPPEAIVQVICVARDPGNSNLSDLSEGTAFRVGSYYLSVRHVTSARGQCFIGKQRIHIVYTSPSSDFSMLAADDGPFLSVDCGGFVKGRKYVAIGYARGQSPYTKIEMTATGAVANGFSVLTGMLTVIPGMSGGPIVDAETGKVAGTVNVDDFQDGRSGSVALSGTPICAKGAA